VPERLGEGASRVVLPGDERTAVKDPVIRFAAGLWHGWTWHGAALAPQEGTWNARSVRVTAVLPTVAYYDGRASDDENFHERTGIAAGVPTGGLATARLRAQGERAIADVRYVDAVPEPGGGLRLYYEAPRPDGAHELRTERVPGTR
jgi:hypothetical protein